MKNPAAKPLIEIRKEVVSKPRLESFAVWGWAEPKRPGNHKACYSNPLG